MEHKALKKSSRSNMFYIVILIFTILILTIISLGIKFVKLLSDSVFTTPSFNVLVLDQNARVIHVDKKNHEIAIFQIDNAGQEISRLTNLGAALTFRVPIDARITYDSDSKVDNKRFFSLKHIANSLFGSSGAQYKKMNASDVMKMYLVARSIERGQMKIVRREEKYLKQPNKDIDEELTDAFRDETIVNEQVSVEVVNATGIPGFGSRMSQILENAGYNVIAVRNGEKVDSQIIDRTTNPGFTQAYLSRFLGIPLTSDSDTPVADVSVVFGE